MLAGMAIMFAATSEAAPPVGFIDEPVVSGLSQPMAIEFLPDGRMLIVHKPGDIRIADPTAAPTTSSPYLTLSDVESSDQRGLVDIELDPDFAINGFFYVYYTHASSARHRVVRYTHLGNSASEASEFVVWEDNEDWSGIGHIGGGLAVGPDGFIYLATGDENEGLLGGPPSQAQDLTRAGGKVIKVGLDGSTPPGNPFDDGAGPNVDTIWARGLRNPLRASWDFAENRLYIADVGQDTVEEIHEGNSGANYGWSDCEGDCGGNPTFDPPLFEYPHTANGGSIIGGRVYRTDGFPSPYAGAYFYGDFVEKYIRALEVDSDGNVLADNPFADQIPGLVFIGDGPDGALYYINFFSGEVRRIRYSETTTDFFDDFDGAGPGGNWEALNGSFVNVSGNLVENSGQTFTDTQLEWQGGSTQAPDQYAKLQVATAGSRSWGFMFRRGDSSGRHYEVHASSSSTEWRWELMDPNFVERISTCVGDAPLQDGDWIGATIVGSGAATEVAVYRWDTDPDAGGAADPSTNWGTPDCTVEASPSIAVDDGLWLGIRSYTGSSSSSASASSWAAGDLTGAGICGNAIIESPEQCDDGGESAICDIDCTNATCGDGLTNPTAGEVCETDLECLAGEICSGCACAPGPVCGNSIIEPPEQCDDGGESMNCDVDCTDAVCGDGLTNATAGEMCESSVECALGEICSGCTCVLFNGQAFADPFDTPPLDPNWTVESGSFSVSGGVLLENSGQRFTDARLLWGDLTDTPDQYSKLRVVTSGSHSWGFMFRRGDSSGHHYEVHTLNDSTEWRWLLYDPDYVERVATCIGDTPLQDGDWIGATIVGSGATTEVAVYRWDTDPDNGGTADPLSNWGTPDCTAVASPSVAADDGRGLGVRTYTGSQPTSASADSWAAGNLGSPGVCGNMIIEAPEQCDDGGESMTCDLDCTDATCGDGVTNPTAGEACETDLECLAGEICSSCACAPGPVCGNSIIEPPEQCDDGGESVFCDDDCTDAMCGDGLTNPTAGEVCETDGECLASERCTGCTCVVPSGQSFDDPFDSSPLDPNWTVEGGNFAVSGGLLVENSSQRFTNSQLLWGDPTDTPDQYSKLQIVTAASHSWGFMFRRGDSSGLHYEVHTSANSNEWRWELYDPNFIERIGTCTGDTSLQNGDWIGATVIGTGTQTVVSIFRWDTDPDAGVSAEPAANWGPADCAFLSDPSVAVDNGRGLGIRSYIPSNNAPGTADNWAAGDVTGPITPPAE